MQNGGDLAVIDNDEKLIRPNAGDPFQLYDLSADPYETDDLASDRPNRVNELKTWVQEWRASMNIA
jgi:arylsulfatase